MAMTIRAAGLDDLEKILRIATVCVEAPQWSEVTWRTLLKAAAEHVGLRGVLLAHCGDEVHGFVVSGGAGALAEVESVAVHPEHRGQGAGVALCCEAMRRAYRRGAETMELEVRASNTVARRMYAKLGFIEQSTRRAYYREPTEDAVLMSAVLTDTGLEKSALQERKV